MCEKKCLYYVPYTGEILGQGSQVTVSHYGDDNFWKVTLVFANTADKVNNELSGTSFLLNMLIALH